MIQPEGKRNRNQGKTKTNVFSHVHRSNHTLLVTALTAMGQKNDTKNHTEFFEFIKSFTGHKSPVRKLLLLSLFYT